MHWANSDFFHEYATYSWLLPYSYQLPGRYYKLDAAQLFEYPGQNPEEISEQNMMREVRSNNVVDTYSGVQNTGVPTGEGTEDRNEEETKDPEWYKRADDGLADLSDTEAEELEKDKRAEKKAKKDLLKYIDVFRRKTRRKLEDRHLDPVDGQLGSLVVQATSDVYNNRNKTTWRRTYITNVSPYIVRLAYWPTSGTFDKNKWQDWLLRGVCWLISSIGLLIVVRLSSPFFISGVFDKAFADDLSNGCGGSS
jgi:hypothetical protein